MRQTLFLAYDGLIVQLAREISGHIEQYYQCRENKAQQEQFVYGLHRASFQTQSSIVNSDFDVT